MLSLCLLVSACKDKDAPKSPEEVKEAVSALQRQLGDLVMVKTMPFLEDNPFTNFQDTLHVQSARFIHYVLRK